MTTTTIDVRFSGTNGTSPQTARVQFPDPVKGTATFEIDAEGVATFSELSVPTSQAGKAINKDDFDALTAEIQNAKEAVGRLNFVTSVQ